jgi:hypothetical protein
VFAKLFAKESKRFHVELVEITGPDYSGKWILTVIQKSAPARIKEYAVFYGSQHKTVPAPWKMRDGNMTNSNLRTPPLKYVVHKSNFLLNLKYFRNLARAIHRLSA